MEDKVCTFFGNRDTPDRIREPLHRALIDLIAWRGVTQFLVGDSGNFDWMVYAELKEFAEYFPHVRFRVVLSEKLQKKPWHDPFYRYDTVYPAELADVPLRFAIARRNRLMLEKADIVVGYAPHAGGAKKFLDLAEKQGKEIIDLTQIECNM